MGCLYTGAVTYKDTPSGVYQEVGRELIVASLNGGPMSEIETTYRFESKWDPDAFTGVEVKGRCQHPLVSSTGTVGPAGRGTVVRPAPGRRSTTFPSREAIT